MDKPKKRKMPMSAGETKHPALEEAEHVELMEIEDHAINSEVPVMPKIEEFTEESASSDLAYARSTSEPTTVPSTKKYKNTKELRQALVFTTVRDEIHLPSLPELSPSEVKVDEIDNGQAGTPQLVHHVAVGDSPASQDRSYSGVIGIARMAPASSLFVDGVKPEKNPFAPSTPIEKQLEQANLAAAYQASLPQNNRKAPHMGFPGGAVATPVPIAGGALSFNANMTLQNDRIGALQQINHTPQPLCTSLSHQKKGKGKSAQAGGSSKQAGSRRGSDLEQSVRNILEQAQADQPAPSNNIIRPVPRAMNPSHFGGISPVHLSGNPLPVNNNSNNQVQDALLAFQRNQSPIISQLLDIGYQQQNQQQNQQQAPFQLGSSGVQMGMGFNICQFPFWALPHAFPPAQPMQLPQAQQLAPMGLGGGLNNQQNNLMSMTPAQLENYIRTQAILGNPYFANLPPYSQLPPRSQ